MNSNENNQSTGVVESMARSGISLRGDNRGYLQSDFGVQGDLSILEHADTIAERVIRNQTRGITRTVARFLVSERVLPLIAQNERLRGVVETIFPTTLRISKNGERVMVLMGARNHSSRTSIVPRSEMISQVQTDIDYRRVHPVDHVDRTVQLRSRGYSFISHIPEHFINTVYALWHPTFGWELDGVKNRARALHDQVVISPAKRQVWFSGLVNPTGNLVSVATAERADMRVGNGLPPLPLIESSEWSSKEEGKGYMAATNTHLMAQILDDLAQVIPSPTIFAETNFMSKAHRVGLASGMKIAPNSMSGLNIPHILEQHVTVGDGHQPVGLRDFVPAYLPDEVKNVQYNAEARSAILRSRPERTQRGGGV